MFALVEPLAPTLAFVGPPETAKKTGQASLSLSRSRDLLPSRHGDPHDSAPRGFTASELLSNMGSGRRAARSRATCASRVPGNAIQGYVGVGTASSTPGRGWKRSSQ